MPEKTVQKEPGKKPAPFKKPKPQQEVVVQIPLSELYPFPDHPFQVREDASMQETAESVKEYGVLVPALARPREDGGYELIAGHRRKHACELAGLATMTTPSMMERYTDQADAFDGLFNMVLGYGIQFLLPCIIGVIAAILFFMERDNDTFKNLRTIPVTSTQMVLAKIIVLFIFGIVFCVASTIATILCGIGTLEVYGIGYKLFLAVETGIFITAGTLPLIVLVVFFSKTYVFSILLCVFYSVLNMSATALFDTLPKTMLWLLPTPLTTFWSAGDMAAHGIKMDLEQMTGLIPSTFQVVFILGIMAFVSFLLIDRLYKQRGE